VGAVVKWIVIGVVVLAVIVLIGSAVPILGRLSGLGRAMERLQRRQAEAMKLQQRVEAMQERLVSVQAGNGKAGHADAG
jgi:hypothetical protein